MFSRSYHELLPAISHDRKIFPPIEDRSFWDWLDSKLIKFLHEEGLKCLDYSWPVVTATSYMRFFEDGDRIANERIHFEKRCALINLTLAECVENKGRFIRQIIDGIWAICEETTWCVSAHTKIGKKTNILPDSEEAIFDLFAGETSSCLATVYLLLREKLDLVTPIICERIKREVTRRIIDEFLRTDDYWWMGKTREKVNNWAPWCTSNALFAAAVFCYDREKCAKIVEKSLEILDRFIKHYGEDGACDEGPSYWGRAGAALADCLDFINIITGFTFDFFKLPLVKNMGEYIVHSHLTSDRYMNFADGPSKNIINVARVYSYGKSCGSRDMMAEAVFHKEKIMESNLRSADSTRRMLGIIFYKEIMDSNLKLVPKKDVWLPSVQIMVAREYEEFDRGLVLTAKGGHNGESHNHNDVGSFMVFDNGKPIFIDAGVGVYTAKTFSPERYTIWTMRSAYHNLPFVGDIEQSAGKEYRAEDVVCGADGSVSSVKMDIAKTFPSLIDRWVREISLNRERSEILITESFKLLKKETVGFTFMTQAEPEITRGNSIKIHGRTLSWDGFDGKAEVEEIKLDDENLKKSFGEKIYRTKIYCNEKTNEGEAKFILK